MSSTTAWARSDRRLAALMRTAVAFLMRKRPRGWIANPSEYDV